MWRFDFIVPDNLIMHVLEIYYHKQIHVMLQCVHQSDSHFLCENVLHLFMYRVWDS